MHKLEPFNGLLILQGLSYNSGAAQNKRTQQRWVPEPAVGGPPKLCCYGVMQN